MAINEFTAIVTKREQLTYDTYLYTFDFENGELHFEAGQYIILLIPQAGGDTARRLYSVASAAQNTKQIQLIVKKYSEGLASNYFHSLSIGDKVQMHGPAGVFVERMNDRPKLFLATSSGIAPLWCMIMTKMNQGPLKNEISLLWGMKNHSDLYFENELKALAAKDPKFTYELCFSRQVGEAPPNRNMVHKRIDVYLKEQFAAGKTFKDFDCYICGGINPTENLRLMLYQSGVPRESVFFERFV